MTNHSVLLSDDVLLLSFVKTLALNSIKQGQYWSLLKSLSQSDPKVPMSEIIPPDPNELSCWTHSPTRVRNVLLPYKEDGREVKENLSAKPFGEALYHLKQTYFILFDIVRLCWHLPRSQECHPHLEERQNLAKKEKRDRTWWRKSKRLRIYCLSDHNMNVACTIISIGMLWLFLLLSLQLLRQIANLLQVEVEAKEGPVIQWEEQGLSNSVANLCRSLHFLEHTPSVLFQEEPLDVPHLLLLLLKLLQLDV